MTNRARSFNNARAHVAVLLSGLLSCAPPAADDRRGEEVETQAQKLTQGTLPGGTSIEVNIATPANGTSSPSGSFSVTGSVAVGYAAPVADTSILYVMDVSGSTVNPSSLGCGGDANDDGNANQVLDCEIAALQALNATVIGAGTVARVGAVIFGASGAAADVDSAPGDQLLVSPSLDNDASGLPDIEDVVTSAYSTLATSTDPLIAGVTKFAARDVGRTTSFVGAINAAAPVLAAMTTPKKLVIFLSDGIADDGPLAVADALTHIGADVTFQTFAVGAGSSCDGALSLVADHGAVKGTCTHVDAANIGNLPNVVPAVVSARITGVTLSIDGGAPQPVDSIAPPPPVLAVSGPVSADFTKTLSGLAPGTHQICAIAEGADASGSNTVTDCVSVLVNRPPVALCQPRRLPASATCTASASIDNGSSDPDADPFTCTQTPAGPYAIGNTAVTLTCSDAHGASASCNATVTVVDVTPPVFNFVPKATTISQCRSPNIGQATANDGCGPVTVTSNAPATFPLGTTIVTWTATDAAGNTVVATQAVTAALGDDPSCCPAGTNVILGSSGDDTLVGTQGRDCILLRGGRDTCNAFGGDDLVSGGAGDDVIDSGDGNDIVFAGAGNDTVMTGNGDDQLDGGAGTDTCNAGGGTNRVTACEILP